MATLLSYFQDYDEKTCSSVPHCKARAWQCHTEKHACKKKKREFLNIIRS